MPYITSVERIGIEKGMQQGMQQGLQQGEAALIERQLNRRFGQLSAETLARLQTATLEQLEQWSCNVTVNPPAFLPTLGGYAKASGGDWRRRGVSKDAASVRVHGWPDAD